jgi:hypothetical protein
MGYYKDRVKVVCPDLMCFPAHPKTLEAEACSCYDAYALTDPDSEPVETISLSEWQRRRDVLFFQGRPSHDRR